MEDGLKKSKTTEMSPERRKVEEAVLSGKQISSFTQVLAVPARE